jgi:arylsulfatase A-like enzyme
MLGIEDCPEEDLYGFMAAYYGMVRFLDDGVEQIMAALDRLGLRQNTVVVFCSDHGDLAGEHGMVRKGGVFYDALTRVPLIVSWPGQLPANQVDHNMANLVDILPTLLSLQGLPVPATVQGQALPTLTASAPRAAVFSEYGAGGPPFTRADLEKLPQPWGHRTIMQTLQWREAEGRRKMVRTRQWKYVHDPMGDKDELYDLERDPWEQYNRIDDAALAGIVADLRLRLLDWCASTEDSSPVPLPSPDKYVIQ